MGALSTGQLTSLWYQTCCCCAPLIDFFLRITPDDIVGKEFMGSWHNLLCILLTLVLNKLHLTQVCHFYPLEPGFLTEIQTGTRVYLSSTARESFNYWRGTREWIRRKNAAIGRGRCCRAPPACSPQGAPVKYLQKIVTNQSVTSLIVNTLGTYDSTVIICHDHNVR